MRLIRRLATLFVLGLGWVTVLLGLLTAPLLMLLSNLGLILVWLIGVAAVALGVGTLLALERLADRISPPAPDS